MHCTTVRFGPWTVCTVRRGALRLWSCSAQSRVACARLPVASAPLALALLATASLGQERRPRAIHGWSRPPLAGTRQVQRCCSSHRARHAHKIYSVSEGTPVAAHFRSYSSVVRQRAVRRRRGKHDWRGRKELPALLPACALLHRQSGSHRGKAVILDSTHQERKHPLAASSTSRFFQFPSF